MSLLVRYTLNDAKHHDAQVAAMADFVADLNAAAIPGLDYSCFETDDATQFIGVLEFADDVAKAAFMGSDARVSDLLCMSNSVHASKPKEHEDNDNYEGSFRRAAERR